MHDVVPIVIHHNQHSATNTAHCSFTMLGHALFAVCLAEQSLKWTDVRHFYRIALPFVTCHVQQGIIFACVGGAIQNSHRDECAHCTGTADVTHTDEVTNIAAPPTKGQRLNRDTAMTGAAHGKCGRSIPADREPCRLPRTQRSCMLLSSLKVHRELTGSNGGWAVILRPLPYTDTKRRTEDPL